MTGRFSFARYGGRDSNPWFRLGNLDVTTTVLFIGLCLAAMVVWAFDEGSAVPFKGLLEPLALRPDGVRSGEVWRLVTWPFPDDPTIWWVLLLAVFWFLGSEVERILGRSKFAAFLAVVTIGTALFGVLVDIGDYGPRTLELCVFIVYVAENPFARFMFGIPGWVLGLVIVGIEAVQLLGTGNNAGLLFRLFSIALALLVAKGMGMLGDIEWIPKLTPAGLRGSGGRSGGGRRLGSKSPRSSKPAKPSRPSRFRGVGSGDGGVVQGPWGERGSGSAADAGPLPQPPGAPACRAADQAALDELLDKISAGGMDSLSPAEKDQLNELSKRMRG